MTYRVSIKGVLLVDGKAVLLRNDRRGWELPGGGLEIGETPEQTLERIVTYGCRLRGGFAPAVSDEHAEFGLYAPAELARIKLPEGYARSIRSWSAHAEA